MAWILNDILFVIILFISFYLFYLLFYLFIIIINCGKQSERLQVTSVRQLLSSGRWERFRQYRLSL